MLGVPRVDTLGVWVEEVREATGGGAIGVEDLCHTDAVTPHWGEIDGERHYFQCFYDAVAMATLVDRRVEVHTESPGGSVLEFRATADGELSPVPSPAVLSFGIDEAVPPSDGDVDPATIYGGICPYVQAFPDREAYERWAADVPAVTAAMPLAEAGAIARALAE